MDKESDSGDAAFGDDYMDSYAEIPDTLIEDSYLAAKKLGGHRRLFSPGDPNEVKWFLTHRDALERAYGEDMVKGFFLNNFGIE